MLAQPLLTGRNVEDWPGRCRLALAGREGTIERRSATPGQVEQRNELTHATMRNRCRGPIIYLATLV
jgi:hypothetical protein